MGCFFGKLVYPLDKTCFEKNSPFFSSNVMEFTIIFQDFFVCEPMRVCSKRGHLRNKTARLVLKINCLYY